MLNKVPNFWNIVSAFHAFEIEIIMDESAKRY